MALGWFGFALISTIAFGIQNFAYKLAADRGCNSATVMSSFIGTTILFSALALALTQNFGVQNYKFFIAFAVINAIAFVATFLLRLEALKLIPLVIGLPLIKMEAALAVLIGVFFLGETLTLPQFAGVVLALSVVWILARQEKNTEIKDFKRGAVLAILAALFYGIADAAVKLAATEGNQLLFIITTYSLMFFPALILQKKFSSLEEATRKTALKWGTIIGVINFISFSTLLVALNSGPMAIIFPMKTLGVGISVALSVVILGEDLTRRRGAGFLIAVVALILLQL